MKLRKLKDVLKKEKTEKNKIQFSEKIFNKDLNQFLIVERLSSGEKPYKNSLKDAIEIRNNKNFDSENVSHKISYVQKRKIEFIPSNLMSYGNLTHNPSNNNNNSPKSKTQTNFNFKNPISDNNKNIEIDYMNYKTNFILRFSKNINNYDKIISILDSLTFVNKTYYKENFFKLKNYSEKKDKILFENSDYKNTSFFDWKEVVLFLYDFENLWQKIIDNLIKELKKNLDLNLINIRKAKDCEEEVLNKNKKIDELENFIRLNDIHTKVSKHNKHLHAIEEIKSGYERNENKKMIEITTLLDTDKKYHNKYHEGIQQLVKKTKEMEDLRLKMNQDIEDKRMKNNQLNFEKHEINLKVILISKEIFS